MKLCAIRIILKSQVISADFEAAGSPAFLLSRPADRKRAALI